MGSQKHVLEWFAKVAFAFGLNFLVVLLVLHINGGLSITALALSSIPTLMMLILSLLTVTHSDNRQ